MDAITFDLRKPIEEVMKAFAIKAHDKRLELVSKVDSSVPTSVVGDPTRLRHLVDLLKPDVDYVAELRGSGRQF